MGKIDITTTGMENMDQGERLISVIAGSCLLYKSLSSIRKNPLTAISGLAASGLLLYRGATGYCPAYKALDIDHSDTQAIQITETIQVNAAREQVYAFWRDFSNLPKFMKHLKTVVEKEGGGSEWIAANPVGVLDLKWNAEITREEENEYIGWQSVEGSMIDNAGKVEFSDALNGLGTELRIEIDYFPPAGSIGKGIAHLFNGIFERMILDDIQNFKRYAETENLI